MRTTDNEITLRINLLTLNYCRVNTVIRGLLRKRNNLLTMKLLQKRNTRTTSKLLTMKTTYNDFF